MIPLLIGAAAALGVGISLLSGADNDDNDDNYEQRKRAKRRQEEKDKELIETEIESFKSKSIKMIKTKYKQDMSFAQKKLKVINSDTSHSQVVVNQINTLKADNKDMLSLIKELEEARDAV